MEPTATAVSLASLPQASPAPTWSICLAGVLIVAPIYLLMRSFVKLVRQTYGFEPVKAVKAPPIRVCSNCHNTVIEHEYTHCPYCGEPLPEPVEEHIIDTL